MSNIFGIISTNNGVVFLRKKNLIWFLTFPFAHNNFTTIGDSIYCPEIPSKQTLEHELIHVRQMKIHGTFKFIFLYFFCFPFFYNPWRYQWEREAFLYGSMISEQDMKKELGSYRYGWLRE